MTDEEMDRLLYETAEDRKLSRSERKALRQVVEDEGLDEAELARFRRRAFEVAHALAHGGRPTGDLLQWLEATIKVLLPSAGARRAEAYFSPGEDCLRAIVSNIRQATRSLDICVFTITDDRISEALLDAHARSVAIRIISDDDKSTDRGSDITTLERRGLAVRIDRSEAHMHHKFAVFDATLLATGSYNWTRSAARANQENLLLTDDPRVVRRYAETFARLWAQFS